ncbi:CDP-glucose 4,6-dehydratase [Clostridium sediminicola]
MDFNLLNLYKNKNVLVTGHTGFKGSWLSIWLLNLGANVIGYSLDPKTKYDNFVLSNLKDKIVDIRGDIRNLDKLKKVFDRYKPEIVFHLAAQPLVMHSYAKPKYTYDVNVMGAVNILECIRHCEETKIGIVITSDKCYRNDEWIWGYRENDALGGYDPYSCSKSCVELLVSSYQNSFFNPQKYEKHGKLIASVRAGNVIGGGDWSENRIIPDCIKALQEKKNISIRSPYSVRPWQHVLEPLSGYLLVGAKFMKEGIKYSGAWNFGPEYRNIVTVLDLANKMVDKWGGGNYVINNNKIQLHEAKLLSLDINKAKYYLKWYPRWNIDITVEKIVEWYKNYLNKNVFDMCENQIVEYCS